MADSYLIRGKVDTAEELKEKMIDNGDGTYSSGVAVKGSSLGNAVSATQTRPADTTPYAAGDVVGTDAATNLEFTNVASAGGAFAVLGARLRIDVAAIPSGMAGFRLHLYNAAPTPIADNAAYNLPAGDRAKYLGFMTILTPVDLGDTLWGNDDGDRKVFKLATASTTVYGILETLGAFTPSSATVKTVTLITAGV